MTGHDCTISITKTPDISDVCTGSTTLVTYTYEVTNNSFFDATVDVWDDNGTPGDTTDDVLVKDDLAVAAGATESFTYGFTVGDSVTNTATATATFADDDSSTDEATATATVTGHDCTITIVKTAGTTDVCNGSDTLVTFTYDVTNNSDQFAATVDVWDDNGTPGDTTDDVLVKDDLAVAAGATESFTYGFTVNGTRTNTAVATATFDDADATTDTDDDDATVTGHDCTISITKTPDISDVCTGSTTLVTYTYEVTNNSFFDATVDVWDDNGTPGDTTDDVLVKDDLAVAAGATESFTYGFTVGDSVTNTATATATFADDDSSTDEATATATVTGHDCTITIVKTAGTTDVCNGSDTLVTFTYDVTNNSDQFAATVDVWDDNGTPGDTTDDVLVKDDLAVAAGATESFTYGFTVNGTRTNTAVATATFDDADATTDTDDDDATVTGHDCTISITKTPSQTEVCNGTTITYSYVVHNNSDFFTWTGDVTDDNGTPADTSDDVTIATGVVLVPGADSTTYTYDKPITGSVTNIATADGDFDDANTTSASDTDDATVVGHECGEGCTPGFWQGGVGIRLWDTVNDPDWLLHGGMGTNPFIQAQTFSSFVLFTPTGTSVDSLSMLAIVGSGGTNSWPRKAARDLIAAYLNASFGISYPYTTGQIFSPTGPSRSPRGRKASSGSTPSTTLRTISAVRIQ